jgi:hypothetical protein
MKLSQHGLFLVEPDGSSHKIAGKTEMDVFNALGISLLNKSNPQENHGKNQRIDYCSDKRLA